MGFSTASSPDGCTHNDTSTAVDNLAAVLAWYKLFPEYATNDFWISGESYAGVYIPMLAYNVYKSNQAGLSSVPLRGVLVGNGCIGSEAGICGQGNAGDGYADYLSLKQFAGHGFLSDKVRALPTLFPKP